MTSATKKVITEVLGMPPSVRAFIAEKLIESLDLMEAPALSKAWKKEIKKRSEEVDRGSVRLRDADAVFKSAFTKIS